MRRAIIIIGVAILLAGGLAKAAGVDFYSDWTIQNGDDYTNPPYDYIALHNSATVTMTGGHIGVWPFDAYDTSTFKLQGGLIENNIAFHGSSTITTSGGTLDGGLDMYDNSVLNFQGGLIINYAPNFYGSSTVNMTSGNTNGFMMHDNSVINISGGNTGFDLMDSSVANLWGGQIRDISAQSSSVVNIYGRDLSIVPYYTQDSLASGHWADGTSFQFVLWRERIYNPQIVFHEIPEPATMLLLGFGMMLARKKLSK
jgi:hypothetical protein